jgi:hypothetical protein
VDWISSLRIPSIHALLKDGTIQPELFDERSLAEISHPDFPGERLVVCRNPRLAAERARKREDLLAATEALLAPVGEAVAAGRLRGAGTIGVRVGKVLNKYKMGKHFAVDIADDHLSVRRKDTEIAAEAALDGIYVVRTSVSDQQLASDAVVRAYKQLSTVERAFRTWKGVDIEVRPIYHWSEDRVRAHVLLCMLAYYVRWHLERAWAPLLFRDEEHPLADDPVAPAERSAAARRKASSQALDDGAPVHSFRTLLSSLKTIVRNRVVPRGLPESAAFDVVTTPTPHQARALALVRVASRHVVRTPQLFPSSAELDHPLKLPTSESDDLPQLAAYVPPLTDIGLWTHRYSGPGPGEVPIAHVAPQGWRRRTPRALPSSAGSGSADAPRCRAPLRCSPRRRVGPRETHSRLLSGTSRPRVASARDASRYTPEQRWLPRSVRVDADR